MRILLSAYACEPGKGSEPEVGFRTMLAAAEHHDVWVLTRQNNADALSEFLRDHPLKPRITIVGFDLNDRLLRLKRLTKRLGTLWYYDRWQKAVRDIASELDREHDFHLVHHITFAAYWGRVGVSLLNKPLVVGPLGGAATTPPGLFPVLGLSGIAGELGRRLIRPLLARATGARHAQRRAAAVIAQNREAMTAIGIPDRTMILPNGLIGATGVTQASEMRSRGESFVYAGRLVAWKGALLAVRVLQHYPSGSATLEVYGSGPLRRRILREAERLGLGHRVNVKGAVSRSELLHRLSTCSALIHPALHDDSPLIIAEALAAGTPVVSLDHGGPPVIASYWPSELSRAVPPTFPRPTTRALAVALSQVAGVSSPPDGSPAGVFITEILSLYERVISEFRMS